MRLLLFVIALFMAVLPLPALAGQAEAKDLARGLNCTVTGIAPVGVETGREGSTDYKVTCLLPTTASEETRKANGTLFIRCDAALCRLIKKGE